MGQSRVGAGSVWGDALARSPLGVLKVRNFRLFYAGQIASNIGTWFQSLAQALLVIDLTGSGKALGTVAALQFTPMLLLGMYGGVLGDRGRPRSLLMVTAGLAALLAATLAVVTALDQVNVLWVWGMALALGCVQAFDRPAAQAFLYELAGPDELSRAVGVYSTVQASARMIGPALAGASYALLGGAACFAINAASFLCVIAALLRMRSHELWQRETQPRDVREHLRAGLRYAFGNRALRTPILANFLVGCLAFNFMTLIAAMIRFEFHAGAGALGAAHAINAVGAVLGGLWLASVRKPGKLHLALACFALGATIAVSALAPSLGFFLVWSPIFGFTVGAYQTTLQSSVQGATEPSMLGRIASLLALGSVGVTPIGSMIVGVLIDAWSARAAMGLGAVSCVVGGCMLLWSSRRDASAAG